MPSNTIPESVVEAVARAICAACEENPDHRGDARGNEFRWQDYRDTALAAINALPADITASQQQTEAFDTDFMRHIASLCRAVYDLCQPKPQRTLEDVREHYGELCLSEMMSVADEIERRLAASSVKAGEVAGWVRGDTFVDAKFWTADTPPQGWTPVYRTASPSVSVGVEWIMELADEYDAKGHHDRAYDLRRLAKQTSAKETTT